MKNNYCVLKIGCFLALFSLGLFHPLFPQSYSNYPVNRSSPSSNGEDLNSAVRQIRSNLTDAKHLLKNHEAEIRMIEGRLSNQETAHEEERVKYQEEIQLQTSLIKSIQLSFETRLQAIEQSVDQLDRLSKGTIADMRQLTTQANESISLLAQYKQKINSLEKMIEEQNQHFQHIENVIQSMIELIQTKDRPSSILKLADSNEEIYVVQQGDFLEKIARSKGITLKELRAANPKVVDDRIAIGQQLIIPKK